MATLTAPPVELTASREHDLRLTFTHSRLFAVIAVAAMVVGLGSVLGGIAGAVYTWDQAATQNVTTPEDARFAEVPVRGPLSMWAQSDIITTHQLERTEGRYFAEMERMVPQLDEAGQPVVGEDGQVVMVPNEARNSWIVATTLTSALGLGIVAYAVSAFAIVMGLTVFGLGFALYKLRAAKLSLT